MKKCILLAMTVLGFASSSYASPKITMLSCRDDKSDFGAVSASLILGTQWGAIAYIGDNYDSAQNPTPSLETGYGMNCQQSGNSIECEGSWAFNKEPAHIVFIKDAAGNVSAVFARSPFYGGATVTRPCVLQKPVRN